MGKTLFILELPEPKVRKAQAPPVKKHKNKKLYSRKMKHKESPAAQGILCFLRVTLFFV